MTDIKGLSDMQEAVRFACFKAKSQKNFAEQLGITRPYLSEVISGKRLPNDKILNAIGFELAYVSTQRQDHKQN